MELIIQNSEDNKIYDISEVVKGVSYTSNIRGGASKLTFSYIKGEGIEFSNGSVVRFKYNDSPIFFGYIFKSERNEGDMISVVSYDQMRYLKGKDTMILRGDTLSSFTKKICDKFKIKYGEIDESSFTLNHKIMSDKTLLDMCYECIDDTLVSTSKKYALFDDFGELKLKDVENMRIPLILGDESGVYGYTASNSIDGETYNRIKVYWDDKENSTRLSYIEQNEENMVKWGTLQFYTKADENSNIAQIKKKAKDLLKLYNREEKKLSLKALGDVRVRGGSGIMVNIEEIDVNKWYMVKKVTHNFNSDIHTMDLELVEC